MEGVKRRKMSHEPHSPEQGTKQSKYKEVDTDEDEEDGEYSDSQGQTAAPTPAPPPPRAEPSSSNAAAQPHQTNLNTLNDPVAIAGVDLAAEEEAIRDSNRRPAGAQYNTKSQAPISFVNKEELQKRVTGIASESSMKSLKADTLDLIGAAVQHRLRHILDAVVLARDHRLRVHAARPPPSFPEQHEQDPESNPVWGMDVSTDVDKILAAMAKVDREEEKTARRARIAKEEAELAEREQADNEANMTLDGEDENGGVTTRRKREKETSARHLTEEQQEKLTNASTRQMLFGRSGQKYSWMHGPVSGSSGGGADSNKAPLPLPVLPNPMLPHPLSGLTASSSAGGGQGQSGDTAGTPTGSQHNGLAANALPNRLINDQEPAENSNVGSLSGRVVWQDLQHVMDKERGHGAGKGTGAQSLFKAGLLRGL